MRWLLAIGVLVAAGAGLLLGSSKESRLTVYAASSLRAAAPEIEPDVRYSFEASGTLQLQIERGAPADVLLSASPKEPAALHRAGRCTRPQTFATNRLVLLVPAGNPDGIRSVDDLQRGRRRLAIGGGAVPVGKYTRALLERMGRSGILRTNTVSSELNVAGITAKVGSRSADAGFAYVTDARAARGRVEAVELPPGAQPLIRYQACAVRRDGDDVERALRWIDGLRSQRGLDILARHGFGAP